MSVYSVFCSEEHKQNYFQSEKAGTLELSCSETDEENNDDKGTAAKDKFGDSENSSNGVAEGDKNQDDEDGTDEADDENDDSDDLCNKTSESSSDLESLSDFVVSSSSTKEKEKTSKKLFKGQALKASNGKQSLKRFSNPTFKKRLAKEKPKKLSKTKQDENDKTVKKKKKWDENLERKTKTQEKEDAGSSDSISILDSSLERIKIEACPKLTSAVINPTYSSDDDAFALPVLSTPCRSRSKPVKKKSPIGSNPRKKEKSINGVSVLSPTSLRSQTVLDSSTSYKTSSQDEEVGQSKRKPCPSQKVSPPTNLASPTKEGTKDETSSCDEEEEEKEQSEGKPGPSHKASPLSELAAPTKKSTNVESSSEEEEGREQSEGKPGSLHKASPLSELAAPTKKSTNVESSSEEEEGKEQSEGKPGPSHKASPLSELAAPTKKSTNVESSSEEEEEREQSEGKPGPSHKASPLSELAAPTKKSTNFESSSEEDKENEQSKEKPGPLHKASPLSKLAALTKKSTSVESSSEEEEEREQSEEKPGPSHKASPLSELAAPTKKSTSVESSSDENKEREQSEEKPGPSHKASPLSKLALPTARSTKDKTSCGEEAGEEEETKFTQSHRFKAEGGLPRSQATPTKEQASPVSGSTSPTRKNTEKRNSSGDVWEGFEEDRLTKLCRLKDKTSVPSTQATLTKKHKGGVSSLQFQTVKSKKRKHFPDGNTDKGTSSYRNTKVNEVQQTTPDSGETSSATDKQDNIPKSTKLKKRRFENTSDSISRDEKRNSSDSKRKKAEKKHQGDASDEEVGSNRKYEKIQLLFPVPSVESLFSDTSNSTPFMEDASATDAQENGYGLGTDLNPAFTELKTVAENGERGKDSGDEECSGARQQEQDGSLEIFDSASDFSECVLVIPMDARHFEPVASDVRKKVAEDFSVEEQHVHFWNVVTPVPLPSSCMLYFFSDIADILQKKNWSQLKLLLLDGTTIQRKHDEEYLEKVRSRKNLPSSQLKHKEVDTLKELIVLRLNKACKKNAYLLGMFTTSSGVNYLSLLINGISDPELSLRSDLHRQVTMYQWRSAAVSFASFDGVSPEQLKEYHLQESTALQNWFTTNFNKLHRIIVLPEEKVLKSGSADVCNYDVFSQLKSRIEDLEISSTCEFNLPVIVFIHRINTCIVHFERYLEAYLKTYVEDFSRQQVICVFPVENLCEKECPKIDLDSSGCHVTLFSAFNPAEKPISLLIAAVKRD